MAADGFTAHHPITRAARKRINAFARNGMAQDRYGNVHETVFVYSDEGCRDFVCWYVGRAEDGDVYTVDHHGVDYVLAVGAGQ